MPGAAERTRMKNLQGAFLLRLQPAGPSPSRLRALVSFFRMSPGPRIAACPGAGACANEVAFATTGFGRSSLTGSALQARNLGVSN